MGRKMRRVMRLTKKCIIGSATVFAFIMLMATTDELVEMSRKSFLIFLVSLGWLVAFCKANGCFNEKECR